MFAFRLPFPWSMIDAYGNVVKPHDDGATPRRDGPPRLPELSLDVELPVLVLTHVKSMRHKANVPGLELRRMASGTVSCHYQINQPSG
jgi:hypothetical protein